MDLEADLSALPCSWIRSTDVGHSHNTVINPGVILRMEMRSNRDLV